MRNKLFLAALLLLSSLFCYSVYSKERLLSSGRVFYLRLAPVDPRSLMQGDYMQLNYNINSSLRYALDKEKTDDVFAQIVLTLDERGIAANPQLFKGQQIGENQVKVNLLRNKGWNPLSVAPASFMFQEGHAAKYEAAKYAMLKTEGGKVLLVALTYEDLTPIN